jgi:hypothetical protein
MVFQPIWADGAVRVVRYRSWYKSMDGGMSGVLIMLFYCSSTTINGAFSILPYFDLLLMLHISNINCFTICLMIATVWFVYVQ